MTKLFTKQELETLKKAQGMIQVLKNHDIHNIEALNKRMTQYKHYKNRASKYNKNVIKLKKLADYLGKEKYREVIG